MSRLKSRTTTKVKEWKMKTKTIIKRTNSYIIFTIPGCLEDGIAPNVTITSLLRDILTQRLLNLLNLKNLRGDKLNSENGSNLKEKQTLEDELNPEEKPTLQFPASNQGVYFLNDIRFWFTRLTHFKLK